MLQPANSIVFMSKSFFFDIWALQITRERIPRRRPATETARWTNDNLRSLSVSQEEQISLCEFQPAQSQ